MDSMNQNESIAMKRDRKLQMKWTRKQTENLIKTVQQKEALWNSALKDYKDRNLRAELWEEVAKEMGLPRHEVTTKWNSVRSSFRIYYNKMDVAKKGEIADDISNDTFYKLKFLEPVFQSEPRTVQNNANIYEHSLNVTSPEESLDEQKRNFDWPLAAQSFNKNQRADTQEENCDQSDLLLNEVHVKSDMWDTVGNFVAVNGREWTKQNQKLGSQFKVAIYKLLAEFQEKSAETEKA